MGLGEARDVRAWKHWVGVMAVTSTLVRGAVVPAIASEEPLERVRTFDPLVGSLIQEGTERSATFRRLIARIKDTDGILYIVVGTCPGQ